jgi:hypothetical protein
VSIDPLASSSSSSSTLPPTTSAISLQPIRANHFKLAFDGCGTAYGCRGVVFAHGLDEQCEVAEHYIHELLTQLTSTVSVSTTPSSSDFSSSSSSSSYSSFSKSASSSSSPLIVNVFGLSRGGCAALFLARRLADIPPASLQLNLCLFDPVPGNLITSSNLDCCRGTTANQALDVSGQQES